MKITKDLLRKIFALSKLSLPSSKEEKMTHDMQEIISFIEVLNEVDTSNVPETNQSNGLHNIYRNDEVKLCEIEEPLLNSTPHTIKNKSICIPTVLKK